MGLVDPVGDGGGCGVREVAFEYGPDPFGGVVLRAAFSTFDDLDAGMFGEPAFGDAAVVGAAVVRDDRDDRGGRVGVEQLLQAVSEHDGDVLDGDVMVPGSGEQVDRAVHGAAHVGAGGQDAVAQAGGHPASGPSPDL